jgi:hypothetical protein
MPREVKHGRRALLEETEQEAGSAAAHLGSAAQLSRGDVQTEPVTPAGLAALAASEPEPAPAPAPRRDVSARWFAAIDASRQRPSTFPDEQAVLSGAAAARRSGGRATAAGVVAVVVLPLLVAVAVAAFALSRPRPLEGLLAVVPAIAAFFLLGRALRRPRPAPAAAATSTSSGRGLELDGERLAFRPVRVTMGADTLLLLDAPFGVTLLASPRRDRLIALLSSATGTFYLGAAFDAAARRAFAPLLDRCFTVVGDDAGLVAMGPDGEPLVLAPDELASLLDALVEQSPSCLDRFVLTDARGASISLDGRSLCIGDRAVDLNAPLEWRPIVFQEAFGQAIAVYQGTWIRQSSTELTLVSLLPALGPAPSEGADGLDLGNLDRAVLRDLRLMAATPEAPPPNEQRVAIDRLFMLPVRHALDRAPRASRQPDRAQA